jgi:hypothetical protein
MDEQSRRPLLELHVQYPRTDAAAIAHSNACKTEQQSQGTGSHQAVEQWFVFFMDPEAEGEIAFTQVDPPLTDARQAA